MITQNSGPSNEKALFAKALLVVMAILIGCIFGASCFNSLEENYKAEYQEFQKHPFTADPPEKYSIGIVIGFGFITSFLYTLLAAVIIRFCQGLRLWAHRGQIQAWDYNTRLLLAALWPFTLIISLIVYTFLGLIHRLF